MSRSALVLLVFFCGLTQPDLIPAEEKPLDLTLFQRDNLVAWCIVPFDNQKRGPEARAKMLSEIGIRKLAYDYRAEHIPTFDAEIEALKKRNIELTAWWFPGTLNEEAKMTLEVFKRHDVHPQLWITGAGKPTQNDQEQKARIQQEAARLRPIAEAAGKQGCQVALYNHGHWFGDPLNQIAIIKELDLPNVGIVYNLHHAHDQLHRFESLLENMKPHLLALNLNGMVPAGDKTGQKIVPIGQGELDQQLLEIIARSGWKGPIGILGHDPQVDAKLRLLDNRNGLEWLTQKIAGKPAGPAPEPKSWKKPASQSNNLFPQKLPKQFDAHLVQQVAKAVKQQGRAEPGVSVFGSAKSACLSCHKIGSQGGVVGPELSQIGKERTLEQLIASVFWPKHEVKPEYASHTILTDDGKSHSGYIVKRDDHSITLKNPASCELEKIEQESIEDEIRSGTLMPEGLVDAMSSRQRLDLLRFLSELGQPEGMALATLEEKLATAPIHAVASFEFDRKPLTPEDWPHWESYINRDRVYDYYAKEAEHFRQLETTPHLLPEFPGLDGGSFGHWGNQHEEVWADDRWNETILGSVQSGVFRGAGLTVPRSVCVQLGENNELSACFNTETLTYDVIWKEGFLKFSSVRHGFMHGLLMDGTLVEKPEMKKPKKPFEYRGFYRHGKQVVFCYLIEGEQYYDVPGIENGHFKRTVFKAESEQTQQHPLQQLTRPGSPQWPQQLETKLVTGNGSPYAVDTIEVPFENPWNALMFFGGHDFLPDGRALACTMQGDVWLIDGLINNNPGAKASSDKVRWKRFASGLFHALGLVVSGEEIYVLGRDQITRLHDLNDDGEADFYENFSNAFETSAAGHDYICGLQRDSAGNFYTASGNQGVVKISADGKQAEVLATGFRNPDGLGLTPEGLLTVPCSEGDWTPASMICSLESNPETTATIPHFGAKGPKQGEPPALPLVYLPRGLDNSSGGQVYIDSDRWGPLKGEQIHLSFGTGSHFLLLKDEVNGQLQGAVVPLPGEFLSGAHRGRFNPADGQLYVSGMAGWGSYPIQDGSFQRVRYTGAPVNLPKKFHVYENGIAITFTAPLDKQLAEQTRSHFAQAWNYRYSGAYGSPEFSPSHIGRRGHDPLSIQSAHVLSDRHTLFLELPDLQPVNQLHLRLHVDAENQLTSEGLDLFLTVHQLDHPFTDYPGYEPVEKIIAAHPILFDMTISTKQKPNRWVRPKQGAREIILQTGKNLTFASPRITVRAGETLSFTLENPDVVPHNWALVKPGSLKKVGELSNRLIADPEAFIRQYIPESSDVLFYTEIVQPQEKMTIYFEAPATPGEYPYLCTFPGHWMVMNGVMIVE